MKSEDLSADAQTEAPSEQQTLEFPSSGYYLGKNAKTSVAGMPCDAMNAYLANSMKGFWRAEYLKRQYLKDLIKSGIKNFSETPEFKFLSAARHEQEEILKEEGFTDPLCREKHCYYHHTADLTDENLRFPFFYNHSCVRCHYRTTILRHILLWHNSICEPEEEINDYRIIPNSSLDFIIEPDGWPEDLKEGFSKLCAVSRKYGLLAFELFGPCSPKKLIENNFDIFGFPMTELFIKEDEEEADPTLLKIARKIHFDESNYKKEITKLIRRYDLVQGIKQAHTTSKKAVINLKKNIAKFRNGDFKKRTSKDLVSCDIIFALNPTKKYFKINKIAKTIALAIDCNTNELFPPQEIMGKKAEYLGTIKSYHETDQSRTFGLYIWDQVNYLGKSPSEAIHKFLNSELYERTQSSDEIETRKVEKERQNKKKKIKLYSDLESSNLYRNYEYADYCIKFGKVLTGAECEREILLERKNKKNS